MYLISAVSPQNECRFSLRRAVGSPPYSLLCHRLTDCHVGLRPPRNDEVICCHAIAGGGILDNPNTLSVMRESNDREGVALPLFIKLIFSNSGTFFFFLRLICCNINLYFRKELRRYDKETVLHYFGLNYVRGSFFRLLSGESGCPNASNYSRANSRCANPCRGARYSS